MARIDLLAKDVKAYKKDPRIKFLYSLIDKQHMINREKIYEIHLHNKYERHYNYLPAFTNEIIEECRRRIFCIMKHSYPRIYFYNSADYRSLNSSDGLRKILKSK